MGEPDKDTGSLSEHSSVASDIAPQTDASAQHDDIPYESHSDAHANRAPTVGQLPLPELGEIVEEIVDEMPRNTIAERSTKTCIVPQTPTTQPLVQEKNVPTQSYAEQLAAALRMKASELSWLFIEAEGRLALAREWTAEAREAGETNWARYMRDIELLESALQDARSMIDTACNYS